MGAPEAEGRRSLSSAAKEVKAAGGAVKAMRIAASLEVEPPPQVQLSEGPASASLSRVSGVGYHTAIARQSASFVIEAVDAEGIRLAKGGTPFFVAVRGSALVKARLTDNQASREALFARPIRRRCRELPH